MIQPEINPILDLQFHLQGKQIPVDHGYALFGAISRVIPEIHDDQSVGILPIHGSLAGKRMMTIDRGSRLTLRLPTLRLKDFLPLAGRPLELKGQRLRVGIPEVRSLSPADRLHCRLAVIKGLMEPDSFLSGVQRQLDSLSISGKPALYEQPWALQHNEAHKGGTRSPYLRRTLQIKGREIVGFALEVADLSPEDSIKLQERGIGGRRRFGCGHFIQVQEEEQ